MDKSAGATQWLAQVCRAEWHVCKWSMCIERTHTAEHVTDLKATPAAGDPGEHIACT
jgi:hypothetical protein